MYRKILCHIWTKICLFLLRVCQCRSDASEWQTSGGMGFKRNGTEQRKGWMWRDTCCSCLHGNTSQWGGRKPVSLPFFPLPSFVAYWLNFKKNLLAKHLRQMSHAKLATFVGWLTTFQFSRMVITPQPSLCSSHCAKLQRLEIVCCLYIAAWCPIANSRFSCWFPY